MNKTIYFLTFIVGMLFLNQSVFSNSQSSDTLIMNPGYTNDIFYSMSDGEVANITRSGWDIAFFTAPFSAGIIINEGNGVQLFSYPNGDTSAWASVDTTGLSTWTPVYNSPEYWEDGAFNRNALGHPDYGWGIYNMVTHSVIGDSLYIINTPEGGFKKLWIVKKVSVDNDYYIKYADLDGSNEVSTIVDVSPYVAKNFIYYSLSTGETIDREPEADWDLLFTKYIDLTETMSGEMAEYLVTGATSNVNTFAKKYAPVSPDYDDWTAQPLDSLKNTVGYNWKHFDMSTFSWVVDDSTVFFVKSHNDNIYKLVFTYWQGSSTGKFAFNNDLVSAAFIESYNTSDKQFSVYPNPATDILNISSSNNENFEGSIIMSDISGREVMRSSFTNSSTINTSNLQIGIYFISIYNDSQMETHKIVVK